MMNKNGAQDGPKKYNVLIIGAGGQGALADAPGSGNESKVISFGHAFKKHHGFRMIEFYDKNTTKAMGAAMDWDCYWTSDFKYHLKKDYYDIAAIATPDETHYEILKQLSEYPLKLVICEKPICTDLQQAREIVELYKAKNIPLMVNYTRRFLPYHQELKRRYEAGKLGKCLYGQATFNRGWLHTGSHAIDFFNLLIGCFDGGPTIGFKNVEDADYRIWQIDIFFEKYHWQEQRIGDMPVWPYYDKSHWHVVDNAYQFLEGREKLECTGEDALQTLEICFELMEEKHD